MNVFKKRIQLSGKHEAGFTLVESIVGITVFLMITLTIFDAYTKIVEVVGLSRIKFIATALANEQFEIVRNLPYEDVGIVGSIPAGVIHHTQIITRDNFSFTVEATVRNIDNPFDGQIGQIPNDMSPADQKLVEIEITCALCKNFSPLSFSTLVAPRSLETASTNGALFVEVFDSVGVAVANADVHIVNNQLFPPITIDDKTNNDGILQIVDAPPSVGGYEITVSKQGYSQERTYPTGGAQNPNPVKPHATVAIQQLTEISFSIDRTSTLIVESVDAVCSHMGNIDFSLEGAKLIGTNPDVLKYNITDATNGSGQKTISGLEWDTYRFSVNDAQYDLAGTIPLPPLILNPNTSQNLKLVVQPKNPRSLLVTVKDAGTQLPLSGADVRLVGEDFDTILTTGQGFLRQTDWSGGSGQAVFTDPLRYFEDNGTVETSDPSGELVLKKLVREGDEYLPSGNLTSSTFDTGSASNFHQLLWQPQSQPVEVGEDSVKFQIATNNDNETWNFIGPDGTASSFYTLTNPDINPVHNGQRYLRYKVFLSTEDSAFTPNVSEISFTFTSQCVPPGQVFFTDLDSGNYDITVSRAGYENFNDTIAVTGSWKEQEVLLAP